MKKIAPEAYGLTDELADLIVGMGADVGAAKTALLPEKKAPKPKPEKKSRQTLTSAAWAAVRDGYQPPPLQFPVSNFWSQKHADKLHALMVAGDADGIAGYKIGGTNTYAKALRTYQAACLAHLETAPKIDLNGEAA